MEGTPDISSSQARENLIEDTIDYITEKKSSKNNHSESIKRICDMILDYDGKPLYISKERRSYKTTTLQRAAVLLCQRSAFVKIIYHVIGPRMLKRAYDSIWEMCISEFKSSFSHAESMIAGNDVMHIFHFISGSSILLCLPGSERGEYFTRIFIDEVVWSTPNAIEWYLKTYRIHENKIVSISSGFEDTEDGWIDEDFKPAAFRYSKSFMLEKLRMQQKSN